MSEVPLTLEELKVEFGKDKLAASLGIFGMDAEDAQRKAASAPADHHVIAADAWRDGHADEMKAVGKIAERALQELPGGKDFALVSIMSDLAKDLYGIGNILGDTVPYLGHVFSLLGEQSEDDMAKCLQAIVAFGDGR